LDDAWHGWLTGFYFWFYLVNCLSRPEFTQINVNVPIITYLFFSIGFIARKDPDDVETSAAQFSNLTA
jgi:hypothetical protein